MQTKTEAFFPVQFRIYKKYTHGKNKGKVNPESVHTLTLVRYVNYVNTGKTLKRAKEMVQEGTFVTLNNPGPETDFEREARRERFGLEVVSEQPKPNDRNTSTRVEAGDETFVATDVVADPIEAVAAA
jgi:hypothetical protein